jgi:hypothetical protein
VEEDPGRLLTLSAPYAEETHIMQIIETRSAILIISRTCSITCSELEIEIDYSEIKNTRKNK